MKKNNKNKRAFTLVELLAVIVILAIILVIAVPRVNDYIVQSKRKTFMNSAKNIARQLEYINIENNAFEQKRIDEFDIELSSEDYDKENSIVYFIDDKMVKHEIFRLFVQSYIAIKKQS